MALLLHVNYAHMLKLIRKIIYIIFISVLFVLMSYLCYFVFKIAYFFISHFYIIDDQNNKILFIALLGLTALLRNFFQVIYPSVYAEEFDRGEVKHYSDVWVTWWPLHNPDLNWEPAIVTIAKKLKLFLDAVTIFLLHTLIPSVTKGMFALIYSFCCTTIDNIVVLFATLIKFCKTYLVRVNKEFIQFRKSYGMLATFSRFRSKSRKSS